MILAAVLLAIPVDAPRLEFYPGRFAVHTPSGDWSASIKEDEPEVPKEAAFRRNDHYAVWDSRGLTIRHGGTSRSVRLEEFPVSGRFFGKDEIQKTVELLADGTRHKAADALSGAVRVGTNAYFLARWAAKDRKPWAEALVRVPLAGDTTWPHIIGRFPGLSLAYKPVDNRLFLLNGLLCCIVRQPDHWGLASYDLKLDRFSFRPLGSTLLAYMPAGPALGTFVESSSYGSTVAGRVDLRSAFRRNLVETHGVVRFLDRLSPPIILISSEKYLRAVNGDTGAEVRLGDRARVARAGPYLVAWGPPADPARATLYAPDRWTPLAHWRAKG